MAQGINCRPNFKGGRAGDTGRTGWIEGGGFFFFFLFSFFFFCFVLFILILFFDSRTGQCESKIQNWKGADGHGRAKAKEYWNGMRKSRGGR